MKASLPNISASTASIIIRKLNRFFKSTSSNLLPPSSKTNFSFPQAPPPPYPQPPPYFRRYRHNPYFTGASEDDTGRGIGSTHVAGSHISGTKVGGFPLGERLTAQRAIDATLSGSDADQTDVPVDIPQSPQARSQPTAIGGILCSSSSSECSNHTLAASPSSVTAGDQQTVQLSPSERAPPSLPCPTLGNAPRRTDQLGSNSCPRGSPDAHLPLLGSAHKVIPSVSVRAAAIRGCGDSSPPQPVPSTKLHERGGDAFESPEKQPTVHSTHCKAVVKNAPVGESQRNRAFAEAHDGVACLHSHGFKPTAPSLAAPSRPQTQNADPDCCRGHPLCLRDSAGAGRSGGGIEDGTPHTTPLIHGTGATSKLYPELYLQDDVVGSVRPWLGERYRAYLYSDSSKSGDSPNNYPLHLKAVPSVETSVIDELVRDTPYEARWKILTAVMTAAHQHPDPTPKQTSITHDEYLQLLQSGHFSEAPKSAIRGFAQLFTVEEPRKKRRRVILWPRTINEAIHREEMPVPSLIGDVAEAYPLLNTRILLDMPAAFYQLRLPMDIALTMGIKTKWGILVPSKLPMGIAYAPEMIQTILHCVVFRSCQQTHFANPVQFHVHIDNVKLQHAEEPAVRRVADLIKAECHKWGLLINEELGTTYCGVEMAHAQNAVRVAPHTLAKIPVSPPRCMAFADLREIVSRIIYAARVLRIPLACYYALIKNVRRIYSKFPAPNQSVVLWKLAYADLLAWIELIHKNTWTCRPHKTQVPSCPTDAENNSDDRHLVLFTDASDIGYGALLLTPGNLLSHSGRWDQKQLAYHITRKEMEAVAIAAKRWQAEIKNAKSLRIIVDNTSVLFSLKKGSSHSYWMNKSLLEALRNLSPLPFTTVEYISSAKMPADGLSRGRSANEVSLAGLRQLLASPPTGSGVVVTQVRGAGCTPTA